MWRKIKRFLLIWDGVWSVPMAFLLFMGYLYWGEWMWPDGGFSGMSPGYLQRLVYALVILVGLNLASWFAIRFNWNSVWCYYLDESGKNFKDLDPIKKICIVLALYFSYFFAGLLLVLMAV